MQKGDTFFMGNPDRDKSHLWIVLSGTNADDHSFIAANVTSGKTSAPYACLLQRDEHPWLEYDSVVNLGDTRSFKDDSVLQEAMNKGIVVPNIPLHLSVVNRIVEAAIKSFALEMRLRDRLKQELE